MTKQQNSEYHAFYVDLPHKDFKENTDRVINHYQITNYLIVGEKTSSGIEHYHFLLYCTQNTYAAIMQWFKSQYGLVGKAKKDGRRQYGKINKIRNLERLKTYMLKDIDQWQLYATNISSENIEKLYANSHKKTERVEKHELLKKQFREKLLCNIKGVINDHEDFDIVKVVHIKRLLAKTACQIWKAEDRPPLMKTLYVYGRDILGEETFMYLYYYNDLK
tara:strand:- start:416 stop:1075 length:660 start_codon:yes stop_codon:yes gene_type:complete